MTEHIAVQLRQTIKQHGGRTATRIRAGNEWATQTFSEFGRRIESIAQALLDLGIQPGDRIGLFANNCPQWSEVDFGVLTVRAILVPLYATSTPEQIRHIAADSDVRVMFVGGQTECERLLEVSGELPALERIVCFDPWEGMPDHITTLDDFLTTPDETAIAGALAAADGADLASIIYTSGTSGEPKGVMLKHEALLRQKAAIEEFFHFGADEHSLCFLPLSHALERAWTTVVLLKGCMNTYVSNPREIADQMVLARATLMVSVPKLYETVYATAHAKVASSALKRRIFQWALCVGSRNQQCYQKGKKPPWWWRAQLPLADKLVHANIREAIGGSKKVLACGGAPLRVEVEEFFSAIGQPIYTGYGLTEASPLVSFNSPAGFKAGTVGKVMPGSRVEITDEGEICYRGPNIMAGYWRDQVATEEVIVDGWLHTGDIGYLDEDGFLVVTDRLKDIIVTLGGKNVAPQPVESLILADPLFEHAVLLGDRRPFVTLLVKPSLPQVEELGQILSWPGEVSDWLRSNELLEELRKRVQRLTEQLPAQDRPKETAIMDEDLTMDNGMVTPTLKVRRRLVEERFRAIIEEMYSRLERMRGA